MGLELDKTCSIKDDMTNASSTYLGIAVGAAIGIAISWWIYNRQNKVSRQQDYILQRIENLEEKNTKILIKLEAFAKHHDEFLNKIIILNEKIIVIEEMIESMTEKQK